jgi:hypothetical protein
MHPVIMRQLAADHIRGLITEAENMRRGQPAPLRRSAGPALSVVAVDALNRGPARLDADMHSVRSSRNVH